MIVIHRGNFNGDKEKGYLGVLSIAEDWLVRVFESFGLINRPSEILFVRDITQSV